MLILEPEIDEPLWTNMGVSMVVRSYLYVRAEAVPFERGAIVDGEKPVPVYMHLLGTGDEPSIITNDLDDGIAAEALHDWIAVHELVDTWKKEAIHYKKVVSQVHLPFIESKEPAGRLMRLYYQLIVEPSGDYELPPLRVEVVVQKSGVTASLLVVPLSYEEDDYCPICTYPLELPVTVDKVRASVRGPLQQYLRAAEMPEGDLYLRANPDIGWVKWDNEGVTISLGLNIHKGHLDVSTYIWIVGKDNPRVVVPNPPTAHPDRHHWIDEAMPLIHDLIEERGLMVVWEGEVAAYKEVMEQVDMGDLVPESWTTNKGTPYLLYRIPITATGARTLELRVRVYKDGDVEAVLWVDKEDSNCALSIYDVRLPITQNGLKAMVRGTLQQYLSYL